MYGLRTALWHVREENKIKADLSIFFLVGPIFSLLSTVEYCEHALNYSVCPLDPFKSKFF